MSNMKYARAYISAFCALALAVVISIALYPAAPLPGGKDVSSNSAAASAVSSDHRTSGSEQSASTKPTSTAVDDPVAYEPGTLLVSLADDISAEDAIAALKDNPQLAGVRLDHVVVDNLVKVVLPAGLAVEDARDAALATDGIAAAQPNFRYYLQDDGATGAPDALSDADASVANAADLAAGTTLDLQATTPNDPYYKKQWYLDSINAPEAWDIAAAAAPSQSHPVTIAVVDADFNADHKDLKDNVASTYSPLGYWESLFDVPDKENVLHGTHVAGTVAAVTNNGIGVAGVTNNLCRVSLMRVADEEGDMTTENIISAYGNIMKKASALNIRVVTMSLGSGYDTLELDKVDQAFFDAIEKARDAGIVTVAAAGNSDEDYTAPYYEYPSDFSNVVSVINVGEANNADGLKRDWSSNYNKGAQKAKNIAAPGERIYNLYKNDYGYLAGTSMATPQVAAIFGLIFTAYPSLSPDEAVSLLYSTAHDLSASKGTSVGWDVQTGFGEADAAAALEKTRAYLSGDPLISGSEQFSVKINGVKQSASSWRWTSSDPSIASVTSTGEVVGHKKGQAIITATSGSKKAVQVVDVQKAGSSSVGGNDVSDLRITVANSTYNGFKRKPVPRVYDGSTLLKCNKDYTVSYANNLDAGKAKVKITGLGSYTGTTTKRFTIRKADISKAKVKFKITSSGNIAVKVYDIGQNRGYALMRGLEYKVSKRNAWSVKITATRYCINFTGSTIADMW